MSYQVYYLKNVGHVPYSIFERKHLNTHHNKKNYLLITKANVHQHSSSGAENLVKLTVQGMHIIILFILHQTRISNTTGKQNFH